MGEMYTVHKKSDIQQQMAYSLRKVNASSYASHAGFALGRFYFRLK